MEGGDVAVAGEVLGVGPDHVPVQQGQHPVGAVAPLDGQNAVDGRIGEGGVQVVRPLPVAGSQVAVAVLVAAGGVDHRLQAQDRTASAAWGSRSARTMPLALSSATRAPGNRGLGNRKAVTPYHSGGFSALGRGNRGGLRRPLFFYCFWYAASSSSLASTKWLGRASRQAGWLLSL